MSEKKESIEQIRKSLKTGKIVLSITNLAASVLFIVAYVMSQFAWYLVLGVIFLVALALTYFFITKLEQKVVSKSRK